VPDDRSLKARVPLSVPFEVGLKAYRELVTRRNGSSITRRAMGYFARDIKVTSETKDLVEENQAFCWNPSISGTKTEDGFIAAKNGPLMITKPIIYPSIEYKKSGSISRSRDYLYWIEMSELSVLQRLFSPFGEGKGEGQAGDGKMSPIGFAIAGSGMVAGVHATALKEIAEARLLGVWSRTLKKTRSFAAQHGIQGYQDYEDLLREPEVKVVILCLPSGTTQITG